VAVYGVPSAGQGRQTSIYKHNWEEVERYQDEAPDGMTGPVAFRYSCVWRRIIFTDRRPREPKPRARRTWETLSPSTRKSYTGTMRRRLGLRTDEQFKHYYESAVDLSLLRRHPPRTSVVKGLGRIAFPAADQGYRDFLITWHQS